MVGRMFFTTSDGKMGDNIITPTFKGSRDEINLHPQCRLRGGFDDFIAGSCPVGSDESAWSRNRRAEISYR